MTAQTKRGSKPTHRARIRNLLSTFTRVNARQVAHALGMPRENATVQLVIMARTGELEGVRVSARRHRTEYRKAQEKTQEVAA